MLRYPMCKFYFNFVACRSKRPSVCTSACWQTAPGHVMTDVAIASPETEMTLSTTSGR